MTSSYLIKLLMLYTNARKGSHIIWMFFVNPKTFHRVWSWRYCSLPLTLFTKRVSSWCCIVFFIPIVIFTWTPFNFLSVAVCIVCDVRAEEKSASACYGTATDDCYLMSLECEAGSQIRLLTMDYGVKPDDTCQLKRNRCFE